MIRFIHYTKFGLLAALLCFLDLAFDRQLETTRPESVQITKLAKADRSLLEAKRSDPPTVPNTNPNGIGSVAAFVEDVSNISEICSCIERTSDRAALEECYCNDAAAWIAANSHLADKMIRDLGVSPSIRLRLDAQIMAERDFVSAYHWADRLPVSDDRVLALSSVFYQAALDNPKDVLEFARDVDLGSQKEQVLRTIILHWSRTDYNAAKQWLALQLKGESVERYPIATFRRTSD